MKESTSWQKQSDEPLFQDILWSRPENKKQAGRLLIIGGHKTDFFAPLQAYEVANKAGVGHAHVVMPDKVDKSILASLEVTGVMSAPSGGISPKAMGEIAQMVADRDAVLVPGSLGRDSGTIMMLESMVNDIEIPITLTLDALDSALKFGEETLDDSKLNLIGSLIQLRSLQTSLHQPSAITHDIGVVKLVEILGELTNKYSFSVSTYCAGQIVSAFDGNVVSTKLGINENDENFRWRLEFATISSVLSLQFTEKRLEALATSAWLFKQGL